MLAPEADQPRKHYRAAFAMTALLVLFWGIGHRLYDTMMPLFAGVFALSGIKLSLTSSVYNFVYCLAALPAAVYARCFGYKAALLMGLGFLAIGAFTLYPASETETFGFFLVSMTALATGWLVLEIAANPLIAAFGPLSSAVFRLNLAQCLYPIGALIGIAAGHWIVAQDLALPVAGTVSAITHPYIIVGGAVVLIAYLIEEADYPPLAQERRPGMASILPALKTLLSEPAIRLAMLAQLAAIFAVGLVWSTEDDLLRTAIPGLPHNILSNLFVYCTALFAIGRMVGTAWMRTAAPARVLLLFALMGAATALAGASGHGTALLIAVIGLNLALSITWPTILGLTLVRFPDEMKLVTALLALAGASGGILYRMAALFFSRQPAPLVMGCALVCCALIAGFAWRDSAKARKPVPSAPSPVQAP